MTLVKLWWAISLPRTAYLKVTYLLAESYVTNIVAEDKHLRERLAFKYLSCLAKPVNPAFAGEITALWCEFEEGITDAARLVRSTDALECMTQAVEYEERLRRQADLKEFMELESQVTVPTLKEWVKHLKQDREDIWSPERADILVLFVLGMTAVIDLIESS